MPTMVGVGEAPPPVEGAGEGGEAAAASSFNEAMREEVRHIVHAAVSDAFLAVEDGERALAGRVNALEKELGELKRALAARPLGASVEVARGGDSVAPPSALPTAPPRFAASAPAKEPTPPPVPVAARPAAQRPALDLTPLMPSVVPSVAPTVVPGTGAAAFAYTPPPPLVAVTPSVPPITFASEAPPAVVAAASPDDTIVTAPAAASASVAPPFVVELGLPSAASARPPRPSIPVESMIPAAPVSLGDVSELLDGARRRKRAASLVVLVLLLAVGAVVGLTIYSRIG